jgi:hypothetical protein
MRLLAAEKMAQPIARVKPCAKQHCGSNPALPGTCSTAAPRAPSCSRQAFALEAENKRLARALAREVGDDVPLSKVLDEGSDWKGRRETIVALRDTVRKLKEQQARALSRARSRVPAASRST